MMAIVLLAVQRLARETSPAMLNSRAAPAVDMGRNFSDNIRDASVETDDGQHAAGQQSDDDQFSHAGHAAAHGLEPGHEGEIPHADANQPRCKEPHGQNGMTWIPARAVTSTSR